MKLCQITNKEIKALKGECKSCSGYNYHADIPNPFCSICQGTGQATIEIEKESIPATFGGKDFQKKIKISKYKIGDEIIYCLMLKERINILKKLTPRLKECDIKLKIISETDKTWRVVMVK